MRIEILCGGGSPVGVHLSDIYGENGRVGVGGAEIALLTLCQGWSNAGHEVILYNNPKRQDGVFEQRNVQDFDHTDKRGDVVIFFREPSPKAAYIRKSKKIFFSCDQYTVGSFRDFSTLVDKVVTISPFHSKYFLETYGIHNSISIDLPVRTWDYERKIDKVSGRIIFTSVPDRGLQHMSYVFSQIKEKVPSASLVITSDYRLWGATSPMNSQFAPAFLRMKDVEFLGAVPRGRLIEEQLKAELHVYPFSGETEELFCISVAESQVAGVFPITSLDGALRTTNMGAFIEGNARNRDVQNRFVEEAVWRLNDKNLSFSQENLQNLSRERFRLERVLGLWDELVFDG